MLSSEHRLRERAEFTHTVRRGIRASSATVVCHVAEGADTRVGFVVSKAVGNAVVRNRVKRRLRHLMADRLDRVRGAVVIRALPPAARAGFDDLADDLDTVLARVLSGGRS